ncbi:MAG: PmbA/TldA family metallopeptidase, partial [Candidatus Hodarchaeota archaeon]
MDILPESDYQALAHQVIKQVAKGGLDVEVYYSTHSTLRISIEQSSIKSEREEMTQSFCFRVAKGKCVGFAYSNAT